MQKRAAMVRWLASVLAVLGLGAGAAPAADCPQWGERHSRNMVSPETHLPETFDPATGKNVTWRVPLGTRTFATPIVAAGRVLIGTNNACPRNPRHKGDRGVLMCLDESTGRLHWQLVVPKRPATSTRTGPISASVRRRPSRTAWPTW